MYRKVAILGRGTAGALSTSFFANNFLSNHTEIEWYYDPNIPTRAVGEGADLSFTGALRKNLNFFHTDLFKLDGTYKSGIYKSGWNSNGSDFYHNFYPPTIAYHFNALKLQDFIYDKVINNQFNSKIKIIEKNISANEIDADFVMDCSGAPEQSELKTNFLQMKYIPTNAVHVTQCFWDYPKFQYTIAEAVSHGWVFLIPLQNRCSVGYLYNHVITDLDIIKDDVKQIFEKYNLNPSENTNSFYYDNYIRKQNFNQNIAYNGNASFFLEPLEATSISTMITIYQQAEMLWSNHITVDMANEKYYNYLVEIQNMIALHYFAGSKFKTPFWDFASQQANECIELALKTNKFYNVIKNSLNSKNLIEDNIYDIEYSTWWIGSFIENIKGLGIEKKLINMISEQN